MLKRVGLAIVVLLAALFLYAANQPAEMRITRSVVINNVSPEAVFPYINNSESANSWMPWKDADPEVKMSYSGPAEGVGSKSSWNSSGQMGTGEALVVESILNQRVKTQLNYTKPFEMKQLAEMEVAAVDGGTRVSWSVSGHKNFLFRLMGVFFDCDSMIGGEFDKGLTKLKGMLEKPAQS